MSRAAPVSSGSRVSRCPLISIVAERALRTVTIDIDGHTITAKPQLNQDAEQILANLPPVAG